MIGQPKDLEKNLENPESFSNDIDLTIPLIVQSKPQKLE